MIATSSGTGDYGQDTTYSDSSCSLTITSSTSTTIDLYDDGYCCGYGSLDRYIEIFKPIKYSINNITYIAKEYIEKIYIKLKSIYPSLPIFYNRRTLFSKSGFIGRVAKRRKS